MESVEQELQAVEQTVPPLCDRAKRARHALNDAIANASGEPADRRWVDAHTAIRSLLSLADALYTSEPLPSMARLRAFVAENADLSAPVPVAATL